jgi:hypothetical protein
MADKQETQFAPWFVPTDASAQSEQMRQYFADLQKRYLQLWQAQIPTAATSNEKLARALRAFVNCRQPQDLVEAESALMTTLLEIAEAHTRPWLEFTRDAQAAWSDVMARAPAAGA